MNPPSTTEIFYSQVANLIVIMESLIREDNLVSTLQSLFLLSMVFGFTIAAVQYGLPNAGSGIVIGFWTFILLGMFAVVLALLNRQTAS